MIIAPFAFYGKTIKFHKKFILNFSKQFHHSSLPADHVYCVDVNQKSWIWSADWLIGSWDDQHRTWCRITQLTPSKKKNNQWSLELKIHTHTHTHLDHSERSVQESQRSFRPFGTTCRLCLTQLSKNLLLFRSLPSSCLSQPDDLIRRSGQSFSFFHHDHRKEWKLFLSFSDNPLGWLPDRIAIDCVLNNSPCRSSFFIWVFSLFGAICPFRQPKTTISHGYCQYWQDCRHPTWSCRQFHSPWIDREVISVWALDHLPGDFASSPKQISFIQLITNTHTRPPSYHKSIHSHFDYRFSFTILFTVLEFKVFFQWKPTTSTGFFT